MVEPKPPKPVIYAVAIGVVVLATALYRRPPTGLVEAVLRASYTVLSGIILYGLYRMRRWAVWAYLLLTAIVMVTTAAIFGLAAWRGLLIAGILRMALVVPSLSYWKRLS